MKTTRKRKMSNKTGRKTRRRPATQALEANAGSALRRSRQTIGRAYEWAQEAAGGARLRSLRLPRRSDIEHLTEANPLLLGAIGLGLGVAIGTLFPRQRQGLMSTMRRSANRRPASVSSRPQRRTRNGAMPTPNTPMGE